MEEFYIGQIFEGIYPPEAAHWCNENGTCHIEEQDDGTFAIVENYIHEDEFSLEDPKNPLEEKIAQLEADNEVLLECILELSELVYA